MYGQLYHRTISRELQEPRRSPGGAGGAVGASGGGTDEIAETRACGKWTRPGPQGTKPIRPVRGPATRSEVPRKVGQRWQHLRAMHDFRALDVKRGGLDGKIRAPCIPNRPIAPGNGRIRRGSCHLDLEKHAFRADIAREGAFFAHSAKNGCIRHDSCQPGPRCRRNARGRRGWRAVGAMRVGLSKRGRRNGAETERHTGAWVQWSRAARCRRCDEGQGSAEIAGRRGRRSGRGKRMDTVQERGARWTRGSAGV